MGGQEFILSLLLMHEPFNLKANIKNKNLRINSHKTQEYEDGLGGIWWPRN